MCNVECDAECDVQYSIEDLVTPHVILSIFRVKRGKAEGERGLPSVHFDRSGEISSA